MKKTHLKIDLVLNELKKVFPESKVYGSNIVVNHLGHEFAIPMRVYLFDIVEHGVEPNLVAFDIVKNVSKDVIGILDYAKA